MKVLYHHRIRSKDGQYVHIEELTRALAGLGHETVVVGPRAVEQERFGADAGAVALLKRLLPRFVYELLELAYALLDYRRLAAAVRRHRPDCLYERYNLYLPSGVWLKRRYGLPMLLEVNAPLYEERSRYGGIALDRLARWSERYVWRGADRVLAVTGVLAQRIQSAGVAPERIVVIPNGIDPGRFGDAPSTGEAKRRLGLEGRLVLGFVGFVREWHGLESVVELLARRPADRHLLVVGDGPARPALERQAHALGIGGRVRFTGVVDREALARHVAAFDVALQPQVVGYASPLKLFEYLALGRAILAPDCPNIREVLADGENAVLFDPDDPTDFERKLEALCADAARRARLGANARATIARRGLTWEANARRVVELYGDLGVSGDVSHLPEQSIIAEARRHG